MTVADAGARGSEWDTVMRELARWLIRHLNDPKLVLWLVKRGGRLHDEMGSWIEHRLEALAKLELEGKMDELERIRVGAPNAIQALGCVPSGDYCSVDEVSPGSAN